MIIYKNIKGIALGTALAATLCLLGSYRADADRLELSTYVRGGVLIGGADDYAVFGEKKAGDNSIDTDSSFGAKDTLSFRAGGSLGYTYDFVEYFGAGLVGGMGWAETRALDCTDGQKRFGILQGFVGVRFDVYPLGEQSFIMGLDVVGKLNITAASIISNGTRDETEKIKVKEETIKAIPVFAGIGGRVRVGYDLRDLIDFPLFLGLDADFTYYLKGILDGSKPADGKTKEILGKSITEETKSPSMDLSVGASIAIDFAYYIF